MLWLQRYFLHLRLFRYSSSSSSTFTLLIHFPIPFPITPLLPLFPFSPLTINLIFSTDPDEFGLDFLGAPASIIDGSVIYHSNILSSYPSISPPLSSSHLSHPLPYLSSIPLLPSLSFFDCFLHIIVRCGDEYDPPIAAFNEFMDGRGVRIDLFTRCHSGKSMKRRGEVRRDCKERERERERMKGRARGGGEGVEQKRQCLIVLFFSFKLHKQFDKQFYKSSE